MIDCYCDYDAPEFHSSCFHKARKTYQCYECGGNILLGDKYERVAGKWDGNFMSFRTCEHCHDIRRWTQNNVPCLCFEYGNMEESCLEAINDAVYRAPKETVGLRFGFYRKIVERNKFNQGRAKI